MKKVNKQRKCKYCSASINHLRSNALYCNSDCKNDFNNSKRETVKTNKPSKAKALTGSHRSTTKMKRFPKMCVAEECKNTPKKNAQRCQDCINNKRLTPKQTKRQSITKDRLLKNFNRSGFGRWMLRQFKRSGGNLGVLRNKDNTHQTLDDLLNLYSMYTACSSGNGRGNNKIAFHRSHLFPAVGKDGKNGLVHYSNFLVAPSQDNWKHSNEDFGFKTYSLSAGRMMDLSKHNAHQLTAIIDIETDGALLALLRLKPHLSPTTDNTNKAPLAPPLSIENVLDREMTRLGFSCFDYGSFAENMHFKYNLGSAENLYKAVMTNSLQSHEH